MNAFVWDEHVVTGLADVDDQHQGLVTLFNDLSQALFTHDGICQDAEVLLGGIFERLVDYTEYHFADEEALMRSVGVDARHIQVHEALHQQFVQQLAALWRTRATMASAHSSGRFSGSQWPAVSSTNS